MSAKVYTVGCDKCNFYVEFNELDRAEKFLDYGKQRNPFSCNHNLGIVQRNKGLDFR